VFKLGVSKGNLQVRAREDTSDAIKQESFCDVEAYVSLLYSA